MSTSVGRVIRKWKADDDNQRVGRDKPGPAEERTARALVAYVLDEIEANYRPSAVLDSAFSIVDPDDGNALSVDLANLTAARVWTVQDVSGTVYVSGGTDVPVTDGGTGASTASGARTNLGLVIGTDVQAYDAELAALAGLTSAADRVPYFTGSGTAALATFTTFGRSLVDDADAATARSTLGLVIGTNVQAFDAELAAIAGLTSAADRLPYFTGSGTAALATFTSAGRALVDDASASAQRTTLGLGTIATQDANNVSITGGSVTGITDLALADGGTGASTGLAAMTNLGILRAVLTSDTVYTSNAGYNTALSFAVVAGAYYQFELVAVVSASTTPGFHFAFDCDASGTAYFRWAWSSADASIAPIGLNTGVSTGYGSATNRILVARGTLYTGSGTTFRFQAGQNVSDAASTTLRALSSLSAIRLA